MVLTAARRATPLLLFATSLALVYSVAVFIVARLDAFDRAHLMAAGVTLDLVVLVPALWYVLVVRRMRWPWISVVPAVLLSLFAASRVIPAAHRGTLNVLELLAVPLELGLLAWLGVRVARAARRARRRGAAASDPVEAIEAVTLDLVRVPRAARIAASELAVLYYGLISWRSAPERGPAAFSVHERSAYGSVMAGLLMLAAVELFPVHLLLSRWNVAAAWVATGLSLYGVLWLAAEWRATLLRPIRLTAAGLELRLGLRWSARIPLEAIEAIERAGGERADEDRAGEGPGRPAIARPPRTLRLAAFGDPDLVIRTRRPVRVRGLYGISRQATRITIAVDEPDRLIERWTDLSSVLPAEASGVRGREGAGHA